MNISDHISESLETIFWVKIVKFLDADVDPDPGIFLSLDLGSGINIPNPQQCIQVVGGTQVVGKLWSVN